MFIADDVYGGRVGIEKNLIYPMMRVLSKKSAKSLKTFWIQSTYQ